VNQELKGVHSDDHIQAMLGLSELSEEERFELGHTFNSIYLHSTTTNCALMAAGSVVEATRWVVDGRVRNAVAVVRPPGHHAEVGCIYDVL